MIKILFLEKDFNQKKRQIAIKKPSTKSKLLKAFFIFFNA